MYNYSIFTYLYNIFLYYKLFITILSFKRTTSNKSELKRHYNRKIKCNKNDNYNCLICNSNFNYESDFLRHEKTKKHIINSNKENLNKSAHTDNTKQNEEIERLKEKLKQLDLESIGVS